MKPARIYFRTKSGIRRLVKLEVAKDGCIYISHGMESKKSKIFRGQITIPKGKNKASSNYRDNLIVDFNRETNDTHSGYKISGNVFHKHGEKYNIFSFPNLKTNESPLLLETIYPGNLSKFMKKNKNEPLDMVVPDQAEYTGKQQGEVIEDLFNKNPFHVEIWRYPYSIPSVEIYHSEPATIKFGVRYENGPYKILVLFCQDKIDIKRGWLEKTRIISAHSVIKEDLKRVANP